MIDSEYAAQFFGFSAKELSLERRFAIQKLLTDTLDSLIKSMQLPPTNAGYYDQQKFEVVQAMCSAFDEELHAIEALDEKHFTIPDYVLLSSDEAQCKMYNEFDEEIEKLKRHFLENSVMIAAIKMENEQYEIIKEVTNDELKVHSLLEKSLNSINNPQNLEDLINKANQLHQH